MCYCFKNISCEKNIENKHLSITMDHLMWEKAIDNIFIGVHFVSDIRSIKGLLCSGKLHRETKTCPVFGIINLSQGTKVAQSAWPEQWQMLLLDGGVAYPWFDFPLLSHPSQLALSCHVGGGETSVRINWKDNSDTVWTREGFPRGKWTEFVWGLLKEIHSQLILIRVGKGRNLFDMAAQQFFHNC